MRPVPGSASPVAATTMPFDAAKEAASKRPASSGDDEIMSDETVAGGGFGGAMEGLGTLGSVGVERASVGDRENRR